MIVYRDLISGDEVLSDAFKLVPVLDAEGNWQQDTYKSIDLSLHSFSSSRQAGRGPDDV